MHNCSCMQIQGKKVKSQQQADSAFRILSSCSTAGDGHQYVTRLLEEVHRSCPENAAALTVLLPSWGKYMDPYSPDGENDDPVAKNALR